MNKSFKEFIKSFYPEFPQYIINYIEDIDLNKRLIIHSHDRRISYTYLRSLQLLNELLNNNNVLDLYHSLFFYFKTNSDGELELMIDVHDQKLRGKHITFIDDNGADNIPEEVFHKIITIKKQTFSDKCLEALEYIKGWT